MSAERFVFGVPLIARAVARDWDLVDHLLGLTLRSALAQSDGDFELVLAGHDAAPSWVRLTRGDERFTFLRADWPPEPVSAANDDGGRKKWLIKTHMRERGGGGLLMFLDADDLVDRELVAAARARIGPGRVAGLVADGFALDFETLHATPFPIPGVFDEPFHRLCGSSTVARIDPTSADPVLHDPHLALGSHHAWEDSARRLGVELVRLPVAGAYLVGTTQSHSEHDGPFAAWRRDVAAGVRRLGSPIDAAFETRFGVTRAMIASHQSYEPSSS